MARRARMSGRLESYAAGRGYTFVVGIQDILVCVSEGKVVRDWRLCQMSGGRRRTWICVEAGDEVAL